MILIRINVFAFNKLFIILKQINVYAHQIDLYGMAKNVYLVHLILILVNKKGNVVHVLKDTNYK
jgi:hypothetical protein